MRYSEELGERVRTTQSEAQGIHLFSEASVLSRVPILDSSLAQDRPDLKSTEG